MKENRSTKDRIIDTAIALFKKKGFNAVSVNEIIDQVGISKNTFYYHFKSKEEILEDFYEVPSDIPASMLEDMVKEASSVGKLFAIYKPRIEYFETLGPNIVKQIIITNIQDDKGTFDKTKHSAPKIHLIQEELIKKAQEDKEIKNLAEPALIMENIRNIFIGVLILWVVDPSIELWPRVERGLKNLLCFQD